MKTPRKNLPLAAYLRVSTAAQAESGVGLDGQRNAIAAASAAQGLTVGAWFEDAGRSGARADNRPGLQAALGEVEAGRLGGIITAKIDRLGRSSADVMGLVERAQRRGWRIVALDVGLDSTTPAGELVAAALAMAARFEYRRIQERQIEKHDTLRRQGRPRGRTSVPAEVADRIRVMRDGGATFDGIAQLLNEEGVPTARGGAVWRPSSVRSALVTRDRELAAQA